MYKHDPADVSQDYPNEYFAIDELVQKFLGDLKRMIIDLDIASIPMGCYLQTDAEDYDEYEWSVTSEGNKIGADFSFRSFVDLRNYGEGKD